MAIDVTDLTNKLGISAIGAQTAHPQNVTYNSGATAPKPSFLGSVAHSVGSVIGGAIGGLGHEISTNFMNTAQGITQGLPGIGSIAQNQKYLNQSLDQISRAQATYTKQYSQGKISKDRYNSLLKDLGKQYSDVSGQAQQASKTVAPADFATGLVSTAALPFAFGKAAPSNLIAGAAAKGNTLAKVAQGVERVGLWATTASTPGSILGNIVKAPVKYGLIDQPIAQTPVQIGQDVQNKNYGDLALQAGLLAGVPAVLHGAPKLAQMAGNAVFGKEGVLDSALGTRLTQYVKAHPEDTARLQRMEQFTLNQPDVVAGKITPGEKLSQHLQSIGVDPQKTDVKTILDNFDKYASNVYKLEDAKKLSGLPEHAVISADIAPAVKAVSTKLSKIDNLGELSASDRVKIANQTLDELGIQNPTVRSQIGAAITSAATGKEAVQGLKPIIQKQIITTPKGLLDKGFIATHGPKDRAALPTLEEAAQGGALQLGKKPLPGLAAVGKTLPSIGLSPQSVPQAKIRGTLIDNLNKELAGTAHEGQGKEVLSGLRQIMDQTKGIFDPRLVKISKIEDAFHVSTSEAKALRGALDRAYANLPLSVRSLGEKATDKAIMFTGPIMRNYIKAIGYGRFTANPIFWVKRDLKSELIGQAEVGGKALNLGRFLNQALGTAPSKETIDALSQHGLFARGQLAGGEADFFGTLFDGTPAQNLARNQAPQYMRQTLGQTAEAFAKQRGTTVAQIYKDGGESAQHLDELLQMVVGYPRNGYLNSNLAKTLNVLIFPSRFETKVGLAAAQYLAKQPPVVAATMVKGLLGAKSWLDSPDGKKWQQNNSEAIGLINYFSPTETIGQIINTLSGHPSRPTDIGAIGGLPFGIISTTLKHQGVDLPGIFEDSPYYDPKTGKLVPSKIPADDKSRAITALTDLVGSLFSYPGKTAGLPSKTDVIQTPLKSLGGKALTPTMKVAPGQSPDNSALPTQKAPILKPATTYGNNFSINKPYNPIVTPPKSKTAKGRKPKTLAKRPGQL